MAKRNFVFLRGTLAQAPYFNRVPNGRRQELTAFLRLYVRVPRDRTQPDAFPTDVIRVVAYGALAERMFPLLQIHSMVDVIGWLQHRTYQSRPLLEVVADELRTGVLDVADERVLAGLRALSRRWDTDVSGVLETLLESQGAGAFGRPGAEEETSDAD